MSDQNISEVQRVLIAMGTILLAIQSTERLIELCITHILQLNGPLTLELLAREKASKRTLGQVLAKMRKHVEIEERFALQLSEFVEKRNVFAHHLQDLPGWTLRTDAGIATANAFLGRLLSLNEVVIKVFSGLARAWARENPRCPQFSDQFEAGRRFETVIDQIFSKKG